MKGIKNWTYGIIQLPPKRTVIHSMCTDHVMFVCVKNTYDVDNASVDDFNVVLSADEPLLVRLVAFFNPVIVSVQAASSPAQVGSRGATSGTKAANSDFSHVVARGIGEAVGQMVYDQIVDPIATMILSLFL